MSVFPGPEAYGRILGIDPGLGASGYGVIDGRQVVEYGVISTRSGGSIPERLQRLAGRLELVIRRSRPTYCAIETLFFRSVGAASVILSAQSRGAILLVLARRGVIVEEITPATIKLALTGSGRASKQQVNYMVKRLLNLDDRVPEHAADALAAAYCFSRRLAGAGPRQ